MKQIYKASLIILILGALTSCMESNKNPLYAEFVSCTQGAEYSNVNLSNMIDEWRNLPISNELKGSYLHNPLKEENAFGPSMWWEFAWSSKGSADEAWNEWTQNEAATSWAEKYQNVMLCDGTGRNAWDIIVPVSASHFSGQNESGYNYSQYWTCSYKNGAGREELEDFLPLHSSKVKASDLEGTGYQYGVYFDRRSEDASHSEVQANMVWGEWAKSAEAMEIQNQNFADNFQEVFEAFDKIGSCLDNPDLFDTWMLYSSTNKDYRPEF